MHRPDSQLENSGQPIGQMMAERHGIPERPMYKTSCKERLLHHPQLHLLSQHQTPASQAAAKYFGRQMPDIRGRLFELLDLQAMPLRVMVPASLRSVGIAAAYPSPPMVARPGRITLSAQTAGSTCNIHLRTTQS